jgi:EAL domain-containing protein (putative c-di-GMP-specific phosphodiesterase class I)
MMHDLATQASHLATPLTRPAQADPSGVRRLLRAHLYHPTALIVVGILVTGAVFELGDRRLFLVLAALAAAQVTVDMASARAGHPISPQLGFRLIVATWPVGLVILGAAGWAPGSNVYYGEVVALVAFVVAGLVALIEPRRFAAIWSTMAASALVLGSVIVGALSVEAVVASGAIVVGAIFGNRVCEILERFLGSRRQLLQKINRLPATGDPFDVASQFIDALVRWTPLPTASITWFTGDGRALLLAITGPGLPAYLAPGKALPAGRANQLRRAASNGPWISGWAVRDDDEGYSRGIAAAGVSAVAYVPLSHEGRLIGLLGAAAVEAAGGRDVLADQFPLLIEIADVAGPALGPSLAALDERSTAGSVIEAVLTDKRFHPVFQPVRELVSDRIVGYEALTRFEEPLRPERVFRMASALGRMRELETVTLGAALDAAIDLPQDCWLSVNATAELLSDPGALGAILDRTRRRIVIELSEHELVEDYAPIMAAMRSLGPRRSLAVDDAGAGFASLRHILEVRPAFVKLDLALVQGVSEDGSRRALVAGMVHFAREAGFALIAEGIETSGDLATLRMLGVDMGQGYLLGRPDQRAAEAHLAAG